MFNELKKKINWQGKELTLQIGKIARQTDASVLCTYGETAVLATVVAAKEAKPDVDFFPLTVHYQEKYFAAGRIPGGFVKREGRPSEGETLTSRLIDRPIRPLFPEEFRNEVQVVVTVFNYDGQNSSDIPAMIAASAALKLSGIPFLGPIAAVRVGCSSNGELMFNPTVQQMENSKLDLVVAGTSEGVLMVESEAQELSEELMLKAVVEGHKSFQDVIALINDMDKEWKKEKWATPELPVVAKDIFTFLSKNFEQKLQEAFKITTKQERYSRIEEIRLEAKAGLESETIFQAEAEKASFYFPLMFKKLESDVVRKAILNTGIRIDGRNTKQIRPIEGEVGIFSRVHGSALFTRGETQAIATATLGTSSDEQIVDVMSGETRQNFMLHYNFPPYSVGEIGRMGSPGRREIGHGKLAWRALKASLPSSSVFPYTIRIVSDITESNGSSSMATVCGGTLAMMDAGVPIARPVAGIAMGLIKEGEASAVLSDILGDEDHLGDMDFKVAGSKNGITALQMDLKITSITPEIMEVALNQAKEGRMHILEKMSLALPASRDELSPYAPRYTIMKINPDKIRDVIGSGGKVIQEITKETGVKIDIEDDGTIKISSVDEDGAQKAKSWIEGIVVEPELDKIYRGKVVKITDFGAFVNFIPGRDGLVHISEISQDRVEKVDDVLKEGNEVWVKLIGFEDRGKIKLSMRVVDQANGNDISSLVSEKKREDRFKFDNNSRGDHRGDRDDNRRGGGDRDSRGGGFRRDDNRRGGDDNRRGGGDHHRGDRDDNRRGGGGDHHRGDRDDNRRGGGDRERGSRRDDNRRGGSDRDHHRGDRDDNRRGGGGDRDRGPRRDDSRKSSDSDKGYMKKFKFFGL